MRLLSCLLPALAFMVIVFGAYVRLTDAGLGCPDWPGCYGHLTVPESIDQVTDTAGADAAIAAVRPLERGKAWREMIHRYLASTLGLGIVVLAAVAWRRAASATARRVALALVPLVIFQGLLGMWTVTLLLKPLVVTAHLFGGLTTLALLWWFRLELRPWPQTGFALPAGGRLHHVAWLAMAVLVLQVFLGAWTSTNYAALACTDFPTCHGRWWPQTDFANAFTLWRGLGIDYEFGVLDTPARTAIHLTHRLGAVAAGLFLLTLGWRLLGAGRGLRRLGWCILAALAAQVTLGISNVLAGLPLVVAVAHNGGAAVLVLLVTTALHATRPLAHNAP